MSPVVGAVATGTAPDVVNLFRPLTPVAVGGTGATGQEHNMTETNSTQGVYAMLLHVKLSTSGKWKLRFHPDCTVPIQPPIK